VRSPLDPFLDCTQTYGGVVILDGGLATELERKGADLADPLWSARLLIEDPKAIEDLHLRYLEAGADVATTASYQASFEGFLRRGIGSSQAADFLRLSVNLAMQARDRFWEATDHCARAARPLVAASVGSYGAALADGSEYTGDFGVSSTQLTDFHRSRIEVLAATDADLLACETIPSLAEAEVLVRVLEEFQEKPAWTSFSCRDDAHVGHGELFSDCIAIAQSCPSVVAVGLNCTAPRHVEPLLREIAGCHLPICAYPNSGEIWDARTKTWRPAADPVAFAEASCHWHAAGARLIGGCCRTGPKEIRAIRAALLPA
jgi:homocysteine S-methyltransferase